MLEVCLTLRQEGKERREEPSEVPTSQWQGWRGVVQGAKAQQSFLQGSRASLQSLDEPVVGHRSSEARGGKQVAKRKK